MWNSVVNRWCMGITIFLGLVFYFWSPFTHYAEGIFWASLVFLGIPHGALDHLIHFHNAEFSPGGLRKFYIRYLSLIAATFLIWFLWPTLAFIAFLIVSAYHFGQSQLYYIPLGSVLKVVAYTSWGLLILSGIIALNYPQCQEMFSSLDWLRLEWSSQSFWSGMSVFSGLLTLGILGYLRIKGLLRQNELIFECCLILLLAFIAYKSDAVITFAVYFGIWHSFRSLVLEYRTLTWLKSLSQFLLKLLPYTTVAVMSLLAINYVVDLFLGEISPFMTFIIVVSALTVPHLMVMHALYQKAEGKVN